MFPIILLRIGLSFCSLLECLVLISDIVKTIFAGGTMNRMIVGIVGLFVLLCMFLTGIELAFAMVAVGFVGFAILNDFNTAVSLLANDFSRLPGLVRVDRCAPFRP